MRLVPLENPTKKYLKNRPQNGACERSKPMSKTRLIAETGAGQHGVATATAAALMGMECVPHVKAYVKSMKDAVRSAN